MKSNAYLYLITKKMQHTQFMWPHAIKDSHLFWLVNHQDTKITCPCQREVQMVIQLGFIQRFVVSVRKDVCRIERRKWVLQNWETFTRPKKSNNSVSWIFLQKTKKMHKIQGAFPPLIPLLSIPVSGNTFFIDIRPPTSHFLWYLKLPFHEYF